MDKTYDSEFQINTPEKNISISLKIGETITSDIYKSITDLINITNSLNEKVNINDTIIDQIEEKVEKMKNKYKSKISELDSKNSLELVVNKIQENNDKIEKLEECKYLLEHKIQTCRKRQKDAINALNAVNFDTETADTVNGRISDISTISDLNNSERETILKLNQLKSDIKDCYDTIGIEEEYELIEQIKIFNELTFKNNCTANNQKTQCIEINKSIGTIEEDEYYRFEEESL